MRPVISRMRRRLRSLRDDIAGMALIEFAYTLPIFLGFGLVGMEFTNVVLANQKTERIASTVADQIASNQIPPTERQIGDMFTAIEQIAEPFEFGAGGVVIITGVVGIYDADDDEVQNKVAWQRCSASDELESTVGEEWTGTIDIADGPEVTLPGDVELGQNQMVIVSEVVFPYQEIISQGIVGNVVPDTGVLRNSSMFRTRGGALMNITPVTGVDKHDC